MRSLTRRDPFLFHVFRGLKHHGYFRDVATRLTASKPPALALSAIDGLDGDADGVDLVVVSGVGERTHFVEKHV